jgi:cytochrome P450
MALHSELLAALALAFLCFRYVLYPAFLSPLAKIPTPHPIAALWLWWKERTGCQARSLLDAHRRHGPVVRVEPNHVHFDSLEALRVIFYVGKFDRANWYLQFQNYNGVPNLLTMVDSKRHAARKRIVSYIFLKSYILGSVDFQRLAHILLFDRLLPIFDEATAETGRGVDVFEMAYAIGVEFTGAYVFGTTNGFDIIRKGREHERKAYLAVGRIKVLELKGFPNAAKELEDRNLDMCRRTEDFLISMKEKESNVDAENTESASTNPVVYAQLRDSISEKEGAKNPEETLHHVAAEILEYLEAGRVGIGGALTYILYELTLHPARQSALREELMTVEPPLSHPPGQNRISTSTLRKLDSLPLLNAVVIETLRVRNPIRIPSRRVVPQGGAVIDGFFIPAGTVVSSSAFNLHMNPDAFPEPAKWIPERWLNFPDAAAEQVPNGRASNDPRRWFWTFTSGSRKCLGNNFALIGESTTTTKRLSTS